MSHYLPRTVYGFPGQLGVSSKAVRLVSFTVLNFGHVIAVPYPHPRSHQRSPAASKFSSRGGCGSAPIVTSSDRDTKENAVRTDRKG